MFEPTPAEGFPRPAVQEVQLLFHHLHRRQHGEPAKPQEHHQMVSETHTHTRKKSSVNKLLSVHWLLLAHFELMILKGPQWTLNAP